MTYVYGAFHRSVFRSSMVVMQYITVARRQQKVDATGVYSDREDQPSRSI